MSSSAPPEAAAIKRFRLIAMLEGISYLVLLCIAMPLKYYAGMPGAVRIVGMAHGVLFVAYGVLVAVLVLRRVWSIGGQRRCTAFALRLRARRQASARDTGCVRDNEGREGFGRYVLEARIARGGMGEVFRAAAIGADGFRKPVVIKRVLAHAASQELSDMFVAEAKLMTRLAHPNIVEVFDFGKSDDGAYYLVMELVDGLDLRAFADSYCTAPMPISLALYVVREALRGLSFAHTQAFGAEALVHHDVSPATFCLDVGGEARLRVAWSLPRRRKRLADRGKVVHGARASGRDAVGAAPIYFLWGGVVRARGRAAALLRTPSLAANGAAATPATCSATADAHPPSGVRSHSPRPRG
jgi:integral membrane protein